MLAPVFLVLILIASATPAKAKISAVTVEYTINANNRDAWSGDAHTGNAKNEVRINGYNSTNEPYEFVGNDSDTETAGLEFQIAIPQGSTIQNAFITVKAGSFQNTSPTGAMQIHLYNIANAQPFANGFFGNLINHHPTYAQTTSWNANATWATGSAQQTPDIALFVQTFVNRADYTPGNYIGFAITAGNIQAGRYYGWEDFFANGTPAKLTVSYAASAQSTPTTTLVPTATNRPTTTQTPAPTNAPAATPTNRPTATPTSAPTNAPAATPTNRPTATQPPNSTPISTPASITLSFPISANDRDAMSLSSGSATQEVRISGYGNGSTDSANYVSSDNERESTAMEFNISIPPSAKITNAYITVRAGTYQNTSASGAMSIYLYNTANAAPFVNGLKGDLLQYQPTYSSIIGWPAGTSWTPGSAHQTPNLASFVQTFIARPDYTSGNYIGFVFTKGTLEQNRYYGWQDSSNAGNGAVLTVTYTK